MQTSSDVLIIGAGAAGLSAAHQLAKSGFSVDVAEARSRVGGRILTEVYPDDSFPIELGAEFIHGKSPELFSIISEAGLSVEEVTSSHWYFDNGQLSKSREFWITVDELMTKMDKSIEDKSFKDFLDSVPNNETSERAKAMAARYVEGFHAASIDRVGIHGLSAVNEASDQIEGDRSFRVLNGYHAVMSWLRDEAQKSGANFLLNTPVSALDWQKEPIEARCAPGNPIIRADKALITIPLALLKLADGSHGAISFIPTLPQSKLDAIRSLEIGQALRIVMRFHERFWERLELTGNEEFAGKLLGFIHYPDAPLPTWWTTLHEREPILVGWAGGPGAAVSLNKDVPEITSLALQSLSLIFGVKEDDIRRQLSRLYIHNWQTDPLSKGAYSYLPVGGIEHQLNLAKPVSNRLFFAGEATSAGHVGTVHGAIQSGQRAAREILNASR